MTRIAFLGTGTMGLPMARNLLKAGFELRVWNRSADRARPLTDEGAEPADDPAEAAAGADVLITMLSDAGAVHDTAAQALEARGSDSYWIQMSTIGIEGTDRCVALAESAGVRLVDAPVLGTREPAEQGKLVVLASGPDAAHAGCEPIFDAVGQRTLWLGEAGAGTRGKMVVNSWVVGVVGVLAETVALAEALDLDPQHFFEAIEGGALDLSYARLKGAAMIEHSFNDPAFRLALARKDAELILEAAARQDLELPIMEAVTQRLRRVERDGHGEEDMAATYWASAPAFARTSGSRRTVMPEKDRDDQLAEQEADRAAAEAGAIGGRASAEPAPVDGGMDEAERPLAEAGQGESEGFEEAERELIEHASHGDQHAARQAIEDDQ